MLASIIIPTLNAGPGFDELLASIRKQTEIDLEVIVVDSGSTDETTTVAAKHGCTLVRETQFDHAKTRNLGAAHADGAILVFITQDVQPQNERWLNELIRPILEGRATATYGRQVASLDGPVIERSSRSFNYPTRDRQISLDDLEREGFSSLFFSNANSAVAREAFLKLGGFAYPRIFGEDVDFAFRLLESRGVIHYLASAGVWHTHRYTPVEVLRRYFDIGVVHSLHPEWFKYGGSVTGSGLQLVRSTWSLIKTERKYGEALPSLMDLAARYVGYRLGTWHRSLPARTVRTLSMNKKYWDVTNTPDTPE